MLLRRQLMDFLHKHAAHARLILRGGADAAATLDSATQAVKLILARRQELDRAGRADSPLVVLAGEQHTVPAHYIHHMLVLKGLLAAGQKIAVGEERPRNDLSRLFFSVAGRLPDPSGMEEIRRLDSGGALSLKSGISFSNKWAGYSSFLLCLFLLRRGVAFRHVDAAETVREGGSFIDSSDSLAAQSLQACSSTVAGKDVDAHSAEGIHVRNDHMARRIRELAEDSGARIVFLRCGGAHVAGISGHYEARHSLSAIFRSWNEPFFALRVRNDSPPDHGLKEGEGFLVGAPPDIRAAYGSGGDTGKEAGTPDPCLLDNEADEAAYVHALARRTGLEEIVLSSGERIKEQEKARRDIGQAICEWVRKSPVPATAP